MKQVTLAMLYGPKPSNLSELIANCQKQIARMLGDCFQPYNLHQIHATFVGLDRVPGSAIFNLNLARYRNQLAPMDFSGLLNFIRIGGYFPFQIQIGGFQNRDYPFVSQGQRPYERSFSVMGDDVAIALVIGWPIHGKPITTPKAKIANLVHEGRIYPNHLDEARQAIQAFNVLHQYHRELTDVDNDFYFRIGMIHQAPVDYLLRQRVVRTVRQYLSNIQPIIVEISVSDIYVASYQDETLSVDSTKVWSISDPKVNPEFIQSLYE